MPPPTHADAMLFMCYYKLWDTPLDAEAWTFFRVLQEDGSFEAFECFETRVPRASHEFVLFDRILCQFEQAGVLMKHGLLHPGLYFDAWVSPAATWAAAQTVVRGLRESRGDPHLYLNMEWLADRASAWYATHQPSTPAVSPRDSRACPQVPDDNSGSPRGNPGH